MTKTELNQFQALLIARGIELERRICHRDGIRIERTADQLEEIHKASEHALAVCNIDREFNQLRNIRAAILRIQEGSFGKCQQRNEDVHEKRLAAMPWPSLCIRCQEALDRNSEETPAPWRYLLPDAA